MHSPAQNGNCVEEPVKPVSAIDKFKLLMADVDGPVNSYYTAQALGKSITTFGERFQHYTCHGGRQALDRRFPTDPFLPPSSSLLPGFNMVT